MAGIYAPDGSYAVTIVNVEELAQAIADAMSSTE